ncbi:2-C-methyl-D-erythritol 4-phosphate cytidylyltransferase [Candidatus Saccharibacteria bacterium]|nr:2-C-methyl-D-erythritol 4-phosphate cytidylyltransferase [Candidatus Saccharibacteria bacterium]
MKNIAMIFAGGVGSRMHSDIPKQFLEVGGKPIIIQTLELFELNENVDAIYVACVKEYIATLEEMIRKFNVQKVVRVFPGGETGQDSIYIGLSEIKKDYDDALVLIHDGVRPLVEQKTIDRCVEDALKYGSAVTSTPAFETPILTEDGEYVAAMPERQKVYTAQAPQCFKLSDILKWHEAERMNENPYSGIVDSCGLAFKYGGNPHLTIGNRGNIKVTTLEDYLVLVSNSAAQNYEQLFKLSENRKVHEGENEKN